MALAVVCTQQEGLGVDDAELELASEDEKNPKNAVISLYLRAMAAQQAQEEAEEMLQQKALTNESSEAGEMLLGTG